VAIGVERSRPVSRAGKQVIGHESGSAGTTSISSVTPTPLPCAENAHLADDRFHAHEAADRLIGTATHRAPPTLALTS
jgi:hypothetical protein